MKPHQLIHGMGIYLGNALEMFIVFESQGFSLKALAQKLDANNVLELYKIEEDTIMVFINNLDYQISLKSFLPDPGLKVVKISPRFIFEKNSLLYPSELLTATYLLWEEIFRDLRQNHPPDHEPDLFGVEMMNDVEFRDFEELYQFRYFTIHKVWAMLNAGYEKTDAGVIEQSPTSFIYRASKDTFPDPLSFWINGTKKICAINNSFNSDLTDGKFFPISADNLRAELKDIGSGLEYFLNGENFVSAMKMRTDRLLSGWYFLETPSQYLIIDIVRP